MLGSEKWGVGELELIRIKMMNKISEEKMEI